MDEPSRRDGWPYRVRQRDPAQRRYPPSRQLAPSLMRPLLDGILVIALEQAVAAPFATRQLADLGARVIKIERPGTGDFARHYDDSVNGESSYFVWLNRSKESVTLDIKTDDGHKILHDLVDDADIVVQNLGPGAANR